MLLLLLFMIQACPLTLVMKIIVDGKWEAWMTLLFKKSHVAEDTSYAYIIWYQVLTISSKYCIECHMLLYVTMQILWWHFLGISLQFYMSSLLIPYALLVYFASQHFCNEFGSWMIEGWMENSLSKWRYLQHCSPKTPKVFYNEWQILLGLHLVWATLHGRFTTSVG